MSISLQQQEHPADGPVETALTKAAAKADISTSGEETKQPTRASKEDKIGRNDPCPCGSGKKYKKCGLINSPEHLQNLKTT